MRMRRWLIVFGALLLALPAGGIAAQSISGDPGAAAVASLGSMYIVESVQQLDLDGDGTAEALVVLNSRNRPGVGPIEGGQVAVLLARRGSDWDVVFHTVAGKSTVADIHGYARNSLHPGFITASYHQCGANCNGGEHYVLRFDGPDTPPALVLNGGDDRANITADPTFGMVLLSGPVYRVQDARCCPTYHVDRRWSWQNAALMDTGTQFRANTPDNPLAADWFLAGGANLVPVLQPLVRQSADPQRIGQLFAPTFTVTDLAGTTCTAPGTEAAVALLSIPNHYLGALWHTDSGYRVALGAVQERGATAVQKTASGCTFGGAGIGGYVLTINGSSSDAIIVSAQAVPDAYAAAPDDAVIPPVD